MPPIDDGRPATPLARRRIAELRRIPWLGLRRIARCLGLSLHQVRVAIAEETAPQPVRPGESPRCPTCGATLTKTPCVACRARREA